MSQETSIDASAPRSEEELTRRVMPTLFAIALFVAVATVLSLARNSGVPFVDILYAEEGTVFFTDARTLGWDAIVAPYAGYLHLVPRLTSAGIVLLPIGKTAAAYSVITAVLIALVAVYVFFASRVLLDSWVSRALLAVVIVLPPLAGQTIGSIGNFHWYLIFAAFWALIGNPRNGWWAAAGVVIGASAALSDPLVVLLLPTAAVAIYRYRSWLHGMIVGSVLAGLGVQALVVLGAEQNAPVDSSWADLPALYAFRVAGSLTFGDVHLTGLWERAAWSVPVVAMAAITTVVVLAVVWSVGWRRAIVIAAVVNSMLYLAVSLLVRGTTAMMPVVGNPPPLFSGRYMIVPALFLVVCITVLLDLAVVERTMKYVFAGGIATTWLLVVMASNFLITPIPGGPSWGAGLEAARAECATQSTGEVVVHIAPHDAWYISLPCADL